MRKITFAFVMSLAPSMLLGQVTTSAQGSANASATASTPKSQTTVGGNAQTSSATTTSADVPSSYSADSRAKIDATLSAARQHNLPQQPIRDRIAEGRAKGASEAQVVLAAQHAETRLEVAQRAMIRAGRPQPTQSEVASGNHAMARGASEAQIQTIAQHTPSNRSLVVALDAMSRLEAQGMTPDRAIAQIETSQNASASDQAIGQLQASVATQATAAAALPRGGATATGSVAGTASVVGQSAAGASAGVAGTVGAVVKKPPF